MSKKIIFLHTTLLFFLTLPNAVIAEPLIVNEKTTKIISMAATVPESTRQLLIGMVSYCSTFGEESRNAFNTTFSTWLQRHQGYLAESIRVKADLMTLVKQPGNPPSYQRDIQQMYEVAIPKMIAAKIARNTKPIEVLPNTRAKASRCIADAKMVDQGLWDLKANHPDVARFLDERLRGRMK